jgi:hypothetical protein
MAVEFRRSTRRPPESVVALCSACGAKYVAKLLSFDSGPRDSDQLKAERVNLARNRAAQIIADQCPNHPETFSLGTDV